MKETKDVDIASKIKTLQMIIVTLVTIIGFMCSVIFAWSGLNNRVNNNHDDIAENKSSLEEHCKTESIKDAKFETELKEIKTSQRNMVTQQTIIQTQQNRIIKDIDKLGKKIENGH